MPTLESRVLPSGLRVILERDPYATAAGVVSIVEGGAGADAPGEEGTAHLVEHLSFLGVDPVAETPLPLAASQANAPKAGPITRRDKLIRYAAATNNGLTSPDALMFYELGPVSRLKWLIELEGARLAEPLAGIGPDDVTFERDVIAHEHQLRGDARSGLGATNELFPMLFPREHPYSRPTGGTSASRERLTLATARAYVSKVFRPERITLLVTAPSNAIDLDTIVARLPKALVGDATHPTARPTPVEPPAPPDLPAGPVARRPSSLPMAQLWIAWTLPDGFGPLAATESLLARWVDADLNLGQLRQEDSHIRQTAAVLLPGVKGTALAVRVLLDDGANVDRTTQVVAARVASLWTREKSELELLRLIRGRIASELVLDEAPQILRAVEQAQMAALGTVQRSRAELVLSMEKLAGSDLARFAYQQLGAPRAHAILFTPGEPTAEPVVRHVRARGHDAVAARTSSLFAQAASWDPMDLPDALPATGPVTVSRTSGGMTVVVARRRGRAVTAWLAFHGGYADAAPPLLVELALRVRPDAFDAPTHVALADRGATRDASIETLAFRPTDLDPALELLFTKATLPIRTWPTEDALNRLVIADHAVVDAASERANQAFWHALLLDNPLSHVVDAADLSKVTRSDVDAWIGRVYNVRNALMVVVGDVDPRDVVARAEVLSKKFAAPAWVADVPAVPEPPLRPAPGEHMALVVTPRRGDLTEVRLACLLPHMTAADRTDFDVLRWTVKQRLDAALRFERGDSYDLEVDQEWLRGGTALLQITTFLDAGDLADGLGVLHANWHRWARGSFEPGEVNAARWQTIGARVMTSASNQGIAYHLFNDWNADPAALGKDTFRGDPLSTQPARLAELFATCKANAALGLTGNEKAIRAALERAWPEAK